MNGLGRTLQEARRGRSLTLDDAARETRIPKRFLLALEHEDLAALPPPVYAVGFLRLYARYLDLDPDPLVASFREQTGITLGPQPLGPSALTEFSRSRPQPRLAGWAAAVLLIGSAVAAFFLVQALRPPVTAAWTTFRQAVGPNVGALRLPFLEGLTFSWPAPGGSEGASREAAGIGSIPRAAGDAAGGGDRLPRTAPVPKVIITPPWFLPPVPAPGNAQDGARQMPSVVGQTADEARLALEQLGLIVATEEWWAPEVPAGFVIFQQPAAQGPLDLSKPAVIVISRGPVRLTIPHLVERPREEALRSLRQAGLIGEPVVRYLGPRDLPFATLQSVCNGCVLSTVPPAGAEVPPEGVVTLTVRRD